MDYGIFKSSILNSLGLLELIGNWNASTNTPALASGVGNKGDAYYVSVAGTTNLDGVTDWQIGDLAVFNGSVWWKVDNTEKNEKGISLPPISGNGFAIIAGYKGLLRVEADCTITAAEIMADQSTTTVVDLWKCTQAQYDAGATHPVNGDSITASAPLSLTGAVKNRDTTLTGWTKTLSRGDVLAINVDSNNNAQKIYIYLEITLR